MKKQTLFDDFMDILYVQHMFHIINNNISTNKLDVLAQLISP